MACKIFKESCSLMGPGDENSVNKHLVSMGLDGSRDLSHMVLDDEGIGLNIDLFIR